jgi:preprotein translocase subunit SecD
MVTNIRSRSIVIVAVIIACVVGVIGFPKSFAQLKDNWDHNIRLGLDLKGGSRLVLQVQVQDAVKAEADQEIERLKEDLKKQNITWNSIDRNDPQTVQDADNIQITIKGIPAQQTTAFRSLISERYTEWVESADNSSDYTLRMKPSDLVSLKRDTVEREIQTISNRINQLGLTEPSVQQYGSSGDQYQVLVQLPGVDDPARVKELIGTVAVLQITAVKEGPFASREAALAQHGGVLPLNTKLAKALPRAGSQGDEWYLVNKNPVITGRDMRNARASQDTTLGARGWETSFTLSQDGGKRFGVFTGANVGNRLAVLLDNNIVNVAQIESKIDDSGRITGLSGSEEADDLAKYLRSGSLPAGIVYLEERSVGPSLGADSIHEGFLAGLAGLIGVIVVMLVYYKRSGINAVLALVLNTVVLLACLSYFHAVLTLPGIAGIILTIGMAVDSNVLIFERIREELRAGKSVVSAVDAGFGKAWWTIVDTHVTTIVSCCFLFLFGEGPVRGFAVTLVIGLAANVFTAVFVSRTIFGYELSGHRQMQELSI